VSIQPVVSRPTLLLATALPCLAGCAEGLASPTSPPAVWIPHPAGPAVEAPREPERAPRKRIARRSGRQPNHFWFLFLDDVSERRDWVRVEKSTWEERYPSGAVARYRTLGRVDAGGRVGVIVRRMPDELLEVFIPDIGREAWLQYRVVPDGDWHDLGPMHLIE
jgi:hypothetical protein